MAQEKHPLDPVIDALGELRRVGKPAIKAVLDNPLIALGALLGGAWLTKDSPRAQKNFERVVGGVGLGVIPAAVLIHMARSLKEGREAAQGGTPLPPDADSVARWAERQYKSASTT